MLLTYKLSLPDYLAAQRLHYSRKFSSLMTLVQYYAVFPLLGIYGLYVSLHKLITTSGASWVGGVLGGSVVLCLLPLWFEYNLRRHYRRTRVSDETCSIVFGDQNIQAEMPGYSKSTLEWKAVRSYQVGKKAILVYITQTQFLVIPKRVLEAGQCDELTALLQRKLHNPSA